MTIIKLIFKRRTSYAAFTKSACPWQVTHRNNDLINYLSIHRERREASERGGKQRVRVERRINIS